MTSHALTARSHKRFKGLAVHRSTILGAMHRQRFSYKKTPFAPRRETLDSQLHRSLFRSKTRASCRSTEPLSSNQSAIDESRYRPGIGPLRGWAPVGRPLHGPEEPHSSGRLFSMIGAMSLRGMVAFQTVQGGVKTKDFHQFVRQRLAPALQQDHVVVMDNLAAHHRPEIRQAIEARGARIVFLPPYGPDLNPIESAWAKLKALIRRRFPQTIDALRRAMRAAAKRISPNDAAGWFGYCGCVSAQPP